MLLLPPASLAYGFSNDPVGTHGSRTIMLSELSALLDATDPDATIDAYRDAIVDSNVLGKRTTATRKESMRRLRELYALSADTVLFRALRELWYLDQSARPLLALLCAVGRDPILRATADVILETPTGNLVTPHMVSAAAASAFPDRYNPMMLANIGRHAASSWQQSGHLAGRAIKHRDRAVATPGAVTYALLLGYLAGLRGDLLFTSLWAQLLDAPIHTLHDLAAQASRQAFLDYRKGGGVTEVGFRHLLRDVQVEP